MQFLHAQSTLVLFICGPEIRASPMCNQVSQSIQKTEGFFLKEDLTKNIKKRRSLNVVSNPSVWKYTEPARDKLFEQNVQNRRVFLLVARYDTL
jgi:hypothetical protein